MRCLPLTTTPVPTYLLVVDGSTSEDERFEEIGAAAGFTTATFRRATYEDLAHIRERALVDTALGEPAASLGAIIESLEGPEVALAVDDAGRVTALLVVVDRADLDLTVPDLAAA